MEALLWITQGHSAAQETAGMGKEPG